MSLFTIIVVRGSGDVGSAAPSGEQLAEGLPAVVPGTWAQLAELQRFSLSKLTSRADSHNLRSALHEFGLA